MLQQSNRARLTSRVSDQSKGAALTAQGKGHGKAKGKLAQKGKAAQKGQFAQKGQAQKGKLAQKSRVAQKGVFPQKRSVDEAAGQAVAQQGQEVEARQAQIVAVRPWWQWSHGRPRSWHEPASSWQTALPSRAL
jgi:hypothetical protein